MNTIDIFFEQDNASYRWHKQKLDVRTKYQDIFILEQIKNAAKIKMQGGEPFFKNRLSKYLDIADSDVELIIETNGSRFDADLLQRFKNLKVVLKVDACGKHQEYIRPGIQWTDIQNTINTLSKNNIDFAIQPVLSVYNILNINGLENYCKDNDYKMHKPTLIHSPQVLRPNNLPYQLRSQVPFDYKWALDGQVTGDPFNLINELDRQWRSSIREVMPEWQKVFDNLHWKNFERLKQLDEEIEKYVG